MKKIIGILGALALIAFVVFKLVSNKKTTENKIYQYDKEKPIAVSADTIRLQSIDLANSYTGTFEPNKESKISADIQGKINAVLVDIGSVIHKDQTLIQLDNALLKYQLQAIEVQLEGLEDDVKRYNILSEADAVQGIQLEKARLALKAAKVQKATLMEQIAKTTIKAPFNGIITAKFNEEGAFAAPGIPLLQLTDISSLRFTIQVPEKDLLYFDPNEIYPIYADVYPDSKLEGKLLMIGSKANLGNSFPIQFQVPNSKNRSIKSGMFGKVQLSHTIQNQGILIPTSAIVDQNGKSMVYLIINGKATLQPISTSQNIGNKTLVSEGLKEGDILIVKGFINLFDGAPISLNQ